MKNPRYKVTLTTQATVKTYELVVEPAEDAAIKIRTAFIRRDALQFKTGKGQTIFINTQHIMLLEEVSNE